MAAVVGRDLSQAIGLAYDRPQVVASGLGRIDKAAVSLILGSGFLPRLGIRGLSWGD